MHSVEKNQDSPQTELKQPRLRLFWN